MNQCNRERALAIDAVTMKATESKNSTATIVTKRYIASLLPLSRSNNIIIEIEVW
jgi:hypothetical protein